MSLASLVDMNLSGRVDGDTIVYDADSNMWISMNPNLLITEIDGGIY